MQTLFNQMFYPVVAACGGAASQLWDHQFRQGVNDGSGEHQHRKHHAAYQPKSCQGVTNALI